MVTLNKIKTFVFNGSHTNQVPETRLLFGASLKGLNKDVFTRNVTSFGISNEPVQTLSQNMADYPINQFYTMLTHKDFWEGQSRFNKEMDIRNDEEAYFKWFSEKKSIGVKKGLPLPEIKIDGPTGVKTIWQARIYPNRAHELIPLYIIACDWYYNDKNIDNARLLNANQRLAINQLEKDLNVKIPDEYVQKDYNYLEYLKLKTKALAGTY